MKLLESRKAKMNLKLISLAVVGAALVFGLFSYFSLSYVGGSGEVSPDLQALIDSGSGGSPYFSSAYVESLTGSIESINENSVTISNKGKSLSIPLPAGNTIVVNHRSDGSSIVVPLVFAKAGDYVNVQTSTDADSGRHMETKITVLKRA